MIEKWSGIPQVSLAFFVGKVSVLGVKANIHQIHQM